MLRSIEPRILYFGTQVVLIGTVNEDGPSSLAPMSSAFWLDWRCIFGLANSSQTPQNRLRTGECMLNLPSAQMAAAVDRLALTTGSDPVPDTKRRRGYRHAQEKLARAGLTLLASETVAAPRVAGCPERLEAVRETWHSVAGRLSVIEVRVQRVHVEESLLLRGAQDRIDADEWRPLILSFQQFHGLRPGCLLASTLAPIPETMYRTFDIEQARELA